MAKKSTHVMKPINTIVKKRSLLVPIISVALLILVVVVVFYFTTTKPQGNILATVNGQPIYEEDVTTEYNKLPPEYQARYSKEAVLNQTIDKTLLLQEADKRGLQVTNQEVTDQLQSILAQYGIGDTDLAKILEAQNITLDQYKGFVREELLLNKVLDDAVTKQVSISDSDVAQYYDDNSAEFSAPVGGVIVSHILVVNETTAKEIIAKLGKGESFSTLAQEYSIDNGTKDEGGYLGILTNETNFVPEFKEAALKLKAHQYTRTAINTTYGYHIIQREDDREPLRFVRAAIENQLKMNKQVVLFQEFMKDLRAKATIKYYAKTGIVTQKVVAGSLDGFSQCVSSKAILYGTVWSEFFKDQKALFGASFSYLNYVDCDAKPDLCAAANIQKYPTWVIGSERFGKLSLQEIATKSGCSLPN